MRLSSSTLTSYISGLGVYPLTQPNSCRAPSQSGPEPLIGVRLIALNTVIYSISSAVKAADGGGPGLPGTRNLKFE